MAYGITIDGFNRKRLATILAELDAEMKLIFGDNLNLEPESPDGQVNGLLSQSFADIWEQLQIAYDAFNPSAATGNTLSNLVQLNAIIRNIATFSTVTVDVTGTNGTFIPLGAQVSTTDNVQFATDGDITIAAGVGSSSATAVESGLQRALSGTLTNIDTPITGWTTVDNALDAVEGVPEETDAELRARRNRSIEAAGQSILEAIISSVLEIPDVDDAVIFENTTNITDAQGLVAKSFMILVDGGADADIAEAVFNTKPIGIAMNGTTTEPVVDSQGTSHDIKFQRPVAVDIHIEVSLKPGATYIGDAAMKQAIVDFAVGDLVEGKGFGLGEDVVYSEMYVPFNLETSGVDEVTVLEIDTVDPPTGTSTITIDFDERSSFDIADIDITQV